METMNYSLLFRTEAYVLCILLLIGCVLMVSAGKYLRAKRFSHDEQESKGGVNSLLGALFGLWGFLLAFTFSNSANKFEGARVVTVDESNAIRNVIFRAEVFPDSIRDGFKEDLKIYIGSLINYYREVKNFDEFKKSKEVIADADRRLWARNINAFAVPGLNVASANMFSSLTSMFDIADKRDALLRSGLPDLVVYMLFFLALAISFIGGFTTPVIKSKEWLVIAGFLLLACSIIYITLDLGRPLRGFMQLKTGLDRLVELQKTL
jgi:hypothetical protein